MITARLKFILLLATIMLSSCSVGPIAFDSDKWKAGGPSARGGMTQDLIKSQQLLGKSAAEVEGLLGKPDHHSADLYGYKVVTIGRCHFWDCTMDVVFDQVSSRVRDVTVSD